MQGLELSRGFWETTRNELFAGEFAGLAGRAAVGLAGEGSECFGFDDATSQDHDWGPGYCIWLSDDDCREFGEALHARYTSLCDRAYQGVAPKPAGGFGSPVQRVGVFSQQGFFARHTGGASFPQTIDDWLALSEAGLAAATNGEVFDEGDGSFSALRRRYMAYYPDDLRLKKIAGACLRAAQAGQYNFARQGKRGEVVAAFEALAVFVREVTAIAYALSRVYKPFYKWEHRGLRYLPRMSWLCFELDGLVAHYQASGSSGGDADAVAVVAGRIEDICGAIRDELAHEALSTSKSAFLVDQAVQVNARIADPALRARDIMRY